ncbi:MAG: 1-acyl-sn-glycerol-3-phosphate acyltransferase [Chloroflexi bacterium]|nr:1-acyl-sn-glycerol-3-phosphate acyltransferase [Chloroflexota bacterium]
MPTIPSLPPKPLADTIRPQITQAPRHTFWRKLGRGCLKFIAKIMVEVCLKMEVNGLENIPSKGPALIVVNHLGDADAVVVLAKLPMSIEAFVKSELYDYPLLGWILRLYGVIWIHRGTPDRRALRIALQMLNEGRFFGIAPEGRESLSGSLEEGTEGAAFLALKSGVPILPVTFTGTENTRIYGNLKRLHRTPVTLTVGKAFHLEEMSNRREALRKGTEQIMRIIASQLPEEYRGVYGGKTRIES